MCEIISISCDAFILLFSGIAAAIHTLFWYMESISFLQPKVYAKFGVQSLEEARTCRNWALNQGYYNLFLAIGTGVGIYLLIAQADSPVGRTLVLFCCASMLLASLVLLFSTGLAKLKGVLLQGVPPLLALGFAYSAEWLPL